MSLKMRFQNVAVVSCLVVSVDALAQVDTTSSAYRTGNVVGKLVGFVVLAIVVVAVIKKLLKK